LAASSKSIFWYAIQTHYKREEEARRELEKQDYVVYLPQTRDDAKNTVRPLIEGYLFVSECDRWRSINGTRGVQRVLLNSPEVPGRVLDEDIKWFRDCEDDFGYVRDHSFFAPAPKPRVFTLGEGLVPRSGRFAGLTGSFVKMAEGMKGVELLYMMMNRALKITHPIDDLA
jgi:transcription antitermination factor NusG